MKKIYLWIATVIICIPELSPAQGSQVSIAYKHPQGRTISLAYTKYLGDGSMINIIENDFIISDMNGKVRLSKHINADSVRFVSRELVYGDTSLFGGYFLIGVYRDTNNLYPYFTSLIRLDKNGNIDWTYSMRMGTQGLVNNKKLVEDSQGNIYLYFSFNTTSWVSKLTKHGQHLWTKEYGHQPWPYSTYLTEFAVINDNEIAFLASYGKPRHLCLIDANGVVKYAAQINNSFTEIDPRGFFKSKDGNLVSLGTTGSGVALLKMDLAGNIIWEKSFQNPNFSGMYWARVIEMSDGSFMIRVAAKTYADPGSALELLMSVTSNGDLAESKIVFPNSRLSSGSLAVEQDHFVFTSVTRSLYDGLIYQHSFIRENIQDVCETSNIPFKVTDEKLNDKVSVFTSGMLVKDTNLNASISMTTRNIAYSSSMIDYCSMMLGIDMHWESAGVLSVYPNPASSMVTILTDGLQIDALMIYDLKGSRVLKTGDYNQTLDVSHLDEGLYLVEATIQNKTLRKKLVIAR